MRASPLLLLPLLVLPAGRTDPARPSRWIPTREQIAKAVLPLPAEFRADASVIGYNAAGALVIAAQGNRRDALPGG